MYMRQKRANELITLLKSIGNDKALERTTEVKELENQEASIKMVLQKLCSIMPLKNHLLYNTVC